MERLRVCLVSDLHVDFPQNVQRAKSIAEKMAASDADVLVIAGDISHKLAHVDTTLHAFSAFPRTKLFVAGNHDVWCVKPKPGEPTTSHEKLRRLCETARRNGFVPLDEENAKAYGTTFVGSIGWYDYSYANPAMRLTTADYEGKRLGDLTYMDSAYAHWGEPDAAMAARFSDDVERRLAQASGRVVFVSHHVPLKELVLRRGHASWDFFNAYMGSERLEGVLRRHGVTRFLFGHTHRPVELIEPARCVINNPLGYPREARAPKTAPFEIT